MIKDFLSLVFPEYCFGCKNTLVLGEQYICTDCKINLPKSDFHKEKDNAMARKFWGKVPLTDCLAYVHFSKKGIVQNLLFSLKYEGAKEIGQVMGEEYGRYLQSENYISSFDRIIPVPLHPAKQMKRGYNQAAEFATGLGKGLEMEVHSNAMRRIVHTATQTRKSRFERWKNAEKIFEVTEENTVKNQKILLVDDVVTTGSTLEACVATLYEYGAVEVSVGAIAVA